MAARARRSSAGALVASGLLVALGPLGIACKREEPPPPDRTLERLREEVDRAQRGQSTGRAPDAPEDPNARLAALATAEGGPVDLPLPEDSQTVQLGPLALRVSRLQGMYSVKAGRVELTSPDGFLAVSLLAQNAGAEPVEVDFAHVSLRSATADSDSADDEETFRLAMDAQRGGTWPLQRTLTPGDRHEWVLYFEVPAQAVRRGLWLNVAAGVAPGAAEDVRIPLGTGR